MGTEGLLPWLTILLILFIPVSLVAFSAIKIIGWLRKVAKPKVDKPE